MCDAQVLFGEAGERTEPGHELARPFRLFRLLSALDAEAAGDGACGGRSTSSGQVPASQALGARDPGSAAAAGTTARVPPSIR